LTSRETETKTREDIAEQDERGEQERDEQGGERGAQSSPRSRGNVTGTVLKGAALGGAAGAAIGAWAAFARVMWPDQLESATRAVTGTVSDVGRTAARAAAQTVDPAAVVELLPGNEGRSDAVKRSAREAATAAAKAAREAISTLSEGENGSKSARNRQEGD
jgi:hypothetical protein